MNKEEGNQRTQIRRATRTEFRTIIGFFLHIILFMIIHVRVVEHKGQYTIIFILIFVEAIIVLIYIIRGKIGAIIYGHGILVHEGWQSYLLLPYRVLSLPSYKKEIRFIPKSLLYDIRRRGYELLPTVNKDIGGENKLLFLFIKNLQPVISVKEAYIRCANEIEDLFKGINDITLIKETNTNVINLFTINTSNIDLQEYNGKMFENIEIKEYRFFVLPIHSILEQSLERVFFQITAIDLNKDKYKQFFLSCSNKEIYKEHNKKKEAKTIVRSKGMAIGEIIREIKEEGYLFENTSKQLKEMEYYEMRTRGLSLHTFDEKQKEGLTGDSIRIGNLGAEHDPKTEFRFPKKEFIKNIEVIGAIGYGKTSFILNVVRQIVEQQTGVLIFDVKGEYALALEGEPGWEVYRLNDHLSPLRINMFHTLNEKETSFFLSLVEEVLSLHGKELTAPMKVILEKILLQVITNTQKPNIYTFISTIRSLKSRIMHDGNESTQRLVIEGIQNRLSFLFEEPIFTILNTLETTVEIEQIFNGRGIILDLSDLTNTSTNYTSFYLITTLLLKTIIKRASQLGVTSKLRGVIVFEEALVTLPKMITESQLTTAEQLFILGRSLGLSNIIVAQRWENISDLIHNNTLTKIFFRYVGNTKNFQYLFERHESTDLKKLRVGEYILLNDKIGEVKLKAIENAIEGRVRKINYETLFQNTHYNKAVYSSFSEFKLHLLG